MQDEKSRDGVQEPLAIKILKIPYQLVVASSRFVTKTTTFPLFKLVELTINHFSSASSNSPFHVASVNYALLWWIRFLFVNVLLLFSILHIVLPIYIVTILSQPEGRLVLILSILSTLPTISYGLYRGYIIHSSSASKQWTWKTLWALIRDSYEDFFGFLCFLLILISIVRLPHVFQSRSKFMKGGKWRFRPFIYRQLWMILIDYACLPFVCLLFLLPWRLSEFWRAMEKKSDEDENELKESKAQLQRRKSILEISSKLIVDIPFFLIGTIPLFSWRFKIVWNALKEVSEDERRIVFLKQLVEWAKDLPYFLMAVLLLLTVYRFRFIQWQKRNSKKSDENSQPPNSQPSNPQPSNSQQSPIRNSISTQFKCLMLDPFMSICVLILFLEIRHWQQFKSLISKIPTLRGIELHFASFSSFSSLLKDLLYDILTLFFLISCSFGIWRWKSIFQCIKNSETPFSRQKEMKRLWTLIWLDGLGVCSKLFIWICHWYWSEYKLASTDTIDKEYLDITFSYARTTFTSIPFLLLVLVCHLNPFRFNQFTKMISKVSASNLSSISLTFSFLMILDYISIVALLISVLFVRRASKSWNLYIGHYRSQNRYFLDFEANYNQTAVNHQQTFYIEIWMDAIRSIFETIEDLILILASFLMLCSGWKTMTVFNILKSRGWKRLELWSCFWNFLLDLPIVLSSPLLCWRFPFVLYSISTNQFARENARSIILFELEQTMKEVSLIPFLIGFLGFWRWKNFFQTSKSYYDSLPILSDSNPQSLTNYFNRRKEIYGKFRWFFVLNFMTMISDIFIAFCSLLMILTIWKCWDVVWVICELGFNWKVVMGILFVEWLKDVPFVFIFLPLSLHRFPYLLHKWITVGFVTNKRIEIWNGFIESMKDLPHIFVLVSIVMVGPWRIPIVFNSLRSTTISNSQKRFNLRKQLFLSFLDCFCFVISIPILLTLFRAKILIRKVQEALKDEKKPSVHKVIFIQFLKWLRDIPLLCILLFGILIGSWRIIPTIKILFPSKSTTNSNSNSTNSHENQEEPKKLKFREAAKLMKKTFVLIALDYICLFMLLTMTWRLPSTLKLLWALRKMESVSNHVVIYGQFKHFLKDIPYLPFVFVVILSVYRLYPTLKKLGNLPTNNQRRQLFLDQSISVLLDFVALCGITIILITVYRIPIFIVRFYREPSHDVVFDQILKIFLDLITFVKFIGVFVMVLHFDKLMLRLMAVYRLHKKKVSIERLSLNLKEENSPHFLDDLPKDMKMEILRRLDAKSLVRIGAVSKHWMEISSNNSLWQNLLLRDFPRPASTNRNPKQEYKNRKIRQNAQTVKEIHQDEEDYQNGIRQVVDDVFQKSIQTLYDSLLIPLKLICLPFGLIAVGWLNVRNLFWQKIFVESLLSRIANDIHVKELNRFNAIRWSLLYFIKFVCVVSHDISGLIVLINVILMEIQTVGGGVEFIQAMLLPFMICLQLFFAFGPIVGVWNYSSDWLTRWRFFSTLVMLIWSGCNVFHLGEMTFYWWTSRYQFTYLPLNWWKSMFNKTKTVAIEVFNLILKHSQQIAKALYNIWLFVGGKLAAIFSVIQKVFSFVFSILQIVVIKIVQNLIKLGTLNFRILALMTRACSRKEGLTGELLLIPVVFGWVGWPFIGTFAIIGFHWSMLYLSSLIVSMFFFWKVRGVVRDNWKTTKQKDSATLKGNYFQSTMAVAKTPIFEGHGIALEVYGKIRKNKTDLSQCQLFIEGQEFWSALPKALGSLALVFRYAFHPVSLPAPTILVQGVDQETALESVIISFRFGTGENGSKIKFKDVTLLTKLDQFIEASGDPVFEMRIEYGQNDEESLWGGWKSQGVVCKVRSSPSKLREALVSGSDLLRVK